MVRGCYGSRQERHTSGLARLPAYYLEGDTNRQKLLAARRFDDSITANLGRAYLPYGVLPVYLVRKN